jgi:hypothetical protein
MDYACRLPPSGSRRQASFHQKGTIMIETIVAGSAKVVGLKLYGKLHTVVHAVWKGPQKNEEGNKNPERADPAPPVCEKPELWNGYPWFAL